MRRSLFLVLVAGCGFKAGGGQTQPVDAPEGIDAPGNSGDGPLADAPPDAELDAPSGPQCPASYSAIVGLTTATASKYRFVSTATGWLAAERDCEDDHQPTDRATHLVVLDSTAERTAMIAGPLGTATIANQWIGATDLLSEGTALWVTNQQNTLPIVPTGNADNQDCVRIKNINSDEYRDCNESNAYVCECDAITAASARYPNLPDGNNGGGGGGGGGGFP